MQMDSILYAWTVIIMSIQYGQLQYAWTEREPKNIFTVTPQEVQPAYS